MKDGKIKKEYRVEIKSLYTKDVEASSPEEAKKKVAVHLRVHDRYDTGTFFYEAYDWKRAKVEENEW